MQNLVYKQFEVYYDHQLGHLSIFYSPVDNGSSFSLLEATLSICNPDGTPLSSKNISTPIFEKKHDLASSSLRCILSYGSSQSATLLFALENHTLHLYCQGNCRFRLEGHFLPQTPSEEVLSVTDGPESPHLRAASGPMVSVGDNALFDRQRDFLLKFNGVGREAFSYDWKEKHYVFRWESKANAPLEISLEATENYCRNRFNFPYRGIRKRHGFETPSVGWMTWYAVKFDASEAVVLENATRFKKLFGDYLDARPVLWVDWEWCHNDLKGTGEPGSDMLTPRKSAYPNGLKAVSDKLKEMGFLPALWVGPTNDCQINSFMKAHPDWLLCQNRRWCGQYWFDWSNPDVVKTVIPRMFKQYLAWGYEALKWDAIPMTLWIMAEYREKRINPNISPMPIFRNIAKLARKTIGEDVYMMSCCGVNENDITWGEDSFDGARIGSDIFTWEEFLKDGIARILHFFPLHNTAYYIDADNLVLRKEYSTVAQARTRVSIYGLAGIPITLGDAIKELDEPRVDMLRRIMPVIDVRPGDLNGTTLLPGLSAWSKTALDIQSGDREDKSLARPVQVVRLNIARPFGQWTVAGLSNLTDKPRSYTLHLQDELDLPSGEYAVYDYWNKRYLGVFTEKLKLSIKPFDTVVLRITPVENNRPTVVSVSRHITQGGYELEEFKATTTTASGLCRIVPGETCDLTLLLPDDKAITSCNVPYTQNGRIAVLHLLSKSARTKK
ncbi:MAG: alpha-galactosidase, partial [Victivallales bacterium]|nr:alpha-galactosidase [Victivallales bacterium]